MKKTNLNPSAYGLEEMKPNELKETNGGSVLAAAGVITLAVLYVAGTCIGLANGHKFNGMP